MVSSTAASLSPVSVQESFSMLLDGSDRVLAVNDAWRRFARDNDAPALADGVVNRCLWDLVTDPNIRHIYGLLMGAARSQRRTIQLPFRCDSPDTRRDMLMSLIPRADDGLEIRSWVLRIRPRSPQVLIGASPSTDGEGVHLCSWCKRVEAGLGEWWEVERATRRLGLLGGGGPLTLVHTTCPDCFDRLMREIAAD